MCPNQVSAFGQGAASRCCSAPVHKASSTQAFCDKATTPLAAMSPLDAFANMRDCLERGNARDAVRVFHSVAEGTCSTNVLLLAVSAHTRLGDWRSAWRALVRALSTQPVPLDADLLAELEQATEAVVVLMLAACVDARGCGSQSCDRDALACAHSVRLHCAVDDRQGPVYGAVDKPLLEQAVTIMADLGLELRRHQQSCHVL